MGGDDGELQRYLEYLQLQLMTEGAGPVHDALTIAQWIENGEVRLQSIAQRLGLDQAAVDAMRADARTHDPSTRFDNFWSSRIFQPLLETVLDHARVVGIAPTLPVILAASTDLSAGPVARPSTGQHILFAGVGTSSFCNYWAKAISSLVTAHGTHNDQGFATEESIRIRVGIDRAPLVLAAKLSLYYRLFGTTAGFGVVEEASAAIPYRNALCRGMELFAIAHEVAHFFYEEKTPTASSESASLDLELDCDLYALTICRQIGLQNDWISYTGAGGIALLHACRLSGIAGSPDSRPRGSHPPTVQRLERLYQRAVEFTHDDDRLAVSKYLADLNTYCAVLHDLVEHTLRKSTRHLESM